MRHWIIILSLFTILLTPAVATHAQEQSFRENLKFAAEEEGAGFINTAEPASIKIAFIIGSIVRYIIGFAGVIFVSMTVYAGLMWMFGGGNEEKINKSKTILRNGIIGLLLTFGSWAIYFLVQYTLNSVVVLT